MLNIIYSEYLVCAFFSDKLNFNSIHLKRYRFYTLFAFCNLDILGLQVILTYLF